MGYTEKSSLPHWVYTRKESNRRAEEHNLLFVEGFVIYLDKETNLLASTPESWKSHLGRIFRFPHCGIF